MFLPIMRGTLSLPAARDPEVLERLDPGALYRLCLHYQTYMNRCAGLVSSDQQLINLKIKEVSLYQSFIIVTLVIILEQIEISFYFERI